MNNIILRMDTQTTGKVLNAPVKLINHRQDSHEINHANDRIIASNDEREPGFDFDENEMKKFHIWPRGVVPYFIDEYSYDKVLRDKIRAVLRHTSRMTELRFQELPSPPEDDSRWVFFVNRKGLLGCCDHPFNSFTNEGIQKVNIGYDCLESDHGLAEVILLLVGVPRQHNAPNRDNFIDVKTDNIMRDKHNYFNVLRNEDWLFHDMEYDYRSAGHYDSHKYTKNGRATIVPKQKSSLYEIGNGKCFSKGDIQKIRMLYNYIARKTSDDVILSDCKKMFSPGSNFSHHEHKLKRKIEPRKKPNKYLGLPDEVEKDLSKNETGKITNEEIVHDEVENENSKNKSEENEADKADGKENEELENDAEKQQEPDKQLDDKNNKKDEIDSKTDDNVVDEVENEKGNKDVEKEDDITDKNENNNEEAKNEKEEKLNHYKTLDYREEIQKSKDVEEISIDTIRDNNDPLNRNKKTKQNLLELSDFNSGERQ